MLFNNSNNNSHSRLNKESVIELLEKLSNLKL